MIYLISVCVRAVGGEVPATSTLAPKIGPLGLVSSHYRVAYHKHISGEMIQRNIGEPQYFCHDSIHGPSSLKLSTVWFIAVWHEIINFKWKGKISRK